MKRDISLAAFLLAVGIALYIHLRVGENTERYDPTPLLKQVAQEIEDRAVERTLQSLESPEHYE